MEELKKHIFDERNGLNYTLVGDYISPTYSCKKKTSPLESGEGCAKTIWNNIIQLSTMI